MILVHQKFIKEHESSFRITKLFMETRVFARVSKLQKHVLSKKAKNALIYINMQSYRHAVMQWGMIRTSYAS